MWVTAEAINYLPVLILIFIGVCIGLVLMSVNSVLGVKPDPNNQQKYEVYECGVPPTGTAQQQFSVRYYLIGIVFLLFDVEVVFMYPWAIVYKDYLSQGAFILVEMLTFLAILLVGYFYLLRRHGLEWD